MRRVIYSLELLIGFGPIVALYTFCLAVFIPVIVLEPRYETNAGIMGVMAVLGMVGLLGVYLLYDFLVFEKAATARELYRAYAMCFCGAVALLLLLGEWMPHKHGFDAFDFALFIMPLAVTLHLAVAAFRQGRTK